MFSQHQAVRMIWPLVWHYEARCSSTQWNKLVWIDIEVMKFLSLTYEHAWQEMLITILKRYISCTAGKLQTFTAQKWSGVIKTVKLQQSHTWIKSISSHITLQWLPRVGRGLWSWTGAHWHIQPQLQRRGWNRGCPAWLHWGYSGWVLPFVSMNHMTSRWTSTHRECCWISSASLLSNIWIVCWKVTFC